MSSGKTGFKGASKGAAAGQQVDERAAVSQRRMFLFRGLGSAGLAVAVALRVKHIGMASHKL